jgi:hypothetical protein
MIIIWKQYIYWQQWTFKRSLLGIIFISEFEKKISIYFFCFKSKLIEIINWVFAFMDFMGFSIKISKLHLPQKMMWTYFHVGFDIGLGEFIDGWAFNIQRYIMTF